MRTLLLVTFLFYKSIILANQFDPSLNFSEPGKYAPKKTEQLKYMLGSWKTIETAFTKNGKQEKQGYSIITFMNRGHGYLARDYSEESRFESEEAISFYAFGKSTEKWMLGTVDSNRESVEIFDGNFEGEDLVLKSAVRVNGGANVVLSRITYSKISNRQFIVVTEESIDYGNSWIKRLSRTYNKTKGNFNISNAKGKNGNPNRIDEEKQFDFIIGHGDATQNILLPNGKWIKFPSSTSAVFALAGKAIYEFNWYNIDPSNPEASSSIVRIYNRNMRRWETLFYSNRSNTLLFFGGRKEGRKMILHNFETNSNNRFSKWTFYNIKKNSYSWIAESSSDSGNKFNATWKIEATQH